MADARAGSEGGDWIGRSDDATGQLMSGEESGLAYFGVWQPGTGTQWSRSGMAVDEFAAQDRIYYDQGLRITSLAGRDGKFTVVWRPGDGTQWWRAGMAVDEFAAQDKIYFDQGLRIAALELERDLFTAVWRPGDGTQWWRAGMTVDEFAAQDKIYFDQGLRIAALELERDLFTAVWRPGDGTQWWRAGMTGEEMDAQDQTYLDQGLRLAVMEIENGSYTGVWRNGAGTQWVSRNRCAVDFITEDTAYVSQGLRLALIELQGDPVGAYQYPWKSGDSYGVIQGNNNPPPGSHNGVQAFAFDFGLPAGTQIRAARAGIVEWLQEDLTATYVPPPAAITATNTPFPAGSLQNWGNAVRIRHAGGFTSWYFHIQNNGVLVNVGDSVEAGQPIATSGNTGRTSAPHLHFQVQADSIDWGQSVAVSFGQCGVPTTGTTVTSDNGNANFP
jgi:murein DD-endopeptidase MepM/ murein hydrolase activator NlpD